MASVQITPIPFIGIGALALIAGVFMLMRKMNKVVAFVLIGIGVLGLVLGIAFAVNNSKSNTTSGGKKPGSGSTSTSTGSGGTSGSGGGGSTNSGSGLAPYLAAKVKAACGDDRRPLNYLYGSWIDVDLAKTYCTDCAISGTNCPESFPDPSDPCRPDQKTNNYGYGSWVPTSEAVLHCRQCRDNNLECPDQYPDPTIAPYPFKDCFHAYDAFDNIEPGFFICYDEAGGNQVAVPSQYPWTRNSGKRFIQCRYDVLAGKNVCFDAWNGNFANWLSWANTIGL